MRKLSLLIVTALLLSSCATSEQPQIAAPGVIPNCDEIDESKEASAELKMACLDGSSEIN